MVHRRLSRPPRPQPRYRFFAGKGGVGKTTLAAAAAIAAARGDRRVLAVSTDPAHSLGDALDTTLSATPRPVRGVRGALAAVELDADRALDRWLGTRRTLLRRILERGTYLDTHDIDGFLGLSLPGVDELIGLLELRRLAEDGVWDEVIVDTAPTGHTLRLLAMPATLRQVAKVLDDMHAKHRFLAESLGGRYRPDEADAVIDELDAQARDLQALLRDGERATFSWICLPEVLSLEESRDGVRTLAAEGIAVGEIVVNRVTPTPAASCALCTGRVRAERPVIAATRAAFEGRPVRLVPALPAEPRGCADLRRLARHLHGRPRAIATPALPPPRRAAPAPRTPARWLDAVAPAGTRLLLFAGKGGVGKTTCAAATALALAAARPEERALLMSTDPAHSLGDVLAAHVGDEALRVAGTPAGLRVREIDADRAFRLRRERYETAVDRVFTALRGRSRFDATFDRVVVRDLIALAPPGLDELFGLLSIVAALVPAPGAAAPYGTVIVDTAPTGHALRLLEMPGAALEWVHAVLAILLKYREVIGLGELGAELMDVARGLRELGALLRDPARARVVAVTRAAELPQRETRRLLDALTGLGIAVGAVVVNAVTPPGCPRCRRAAAAERVVIDDLHDAARTRVKAPCPLLLAPAVAPPPRGVAALARWGATWHEAGR